MSSPADIPAIMDRLIAAWCDRRALRPLRLILQGYPPASNLTDESYKLLEAIKDVRGLCRDSLTPEELSELTRAMILLQDALENR
jgi:hypothetical protein